LAADGGGGQRRLLWREDFHMADFNIRSDSVDVEQIMTQIRTRISEKRGVDYTEDQIRELATVRLEKFLDPKNLRSDLLDQFRRSRPSIPAEPPPVEPPYAFSDDTLFASHRGGLRFIRKVLRPILKLFFNPNTLNQILHTQAQFNVDLLKREQRRKMEFDRTRAEWNALYYEVLHNLVLETTRNGIELKNMKMRVEALSSRLDFSERRVRALEGVVQYRPEAVRRRDPDRERGRDRAPRQDADTRAAEPLAPPPTEGPAPRQDVDNGATAATVDPSVRRRRRRRRGRRTGGVIEEAGAGDQTLAADEVNGEGDGFEESDDAPGGNGETGEASSDQTDVAASPRDPEQQ
jgi:hypothetical protein